MSDTTEGGLQMPDQPAGRFERIQSDARLRLAFNSSP